MTKLVPRGVNNILNGVEALGLVREVLQTVQNVYEIKEYEQTRRVAIRAELEYKIAQVESNTKIIIKQLEQDHENRKKLFDSIYAICSNPNPTEFHIQILDRIVPILNVSENKRIEGGCL